MSLENANAIPEAVRKQAERADEIHRKMYPDQYPKPVVSPAERAEETQKAGEGKTAPGGEAPNPAKDRADAPAPGEKPKEETPKIPAEGMTPGPAEDGKKPQEEDNWKQKYEVLQGKYNAEVPQLHMRLAALTNTVRELQSKVQAGPKETPAPPKEKEKEKEPPPKKEEPPESEVVKTFKEEYPDIYEAVAKMIEASKDPGSPSKGGEPPKGGEAPKVEAPPKAGDSPRAETPAPSPETDPRLTFNFYLNRDVPDWQQVNVDPEFIRFLQTPDPNFPGMTKLQSIQAAYDACDSTTVIGHFKDFKDGRAKKSTPENPNPNPNPGKEISREEKFLAPPTGSKGGAPPTVPLVTAADIKKFYDEARRGLWGPINGEKYLKEEARLLSALNKAPT
jgi:hypothetical protein